MAIGRTLPIEEVVDPSGEIHHRMVPYERAGDRQQQHIRKHYRLTTAAGDPFQIVADQAVRITAPFHFTKYGVMVRDVGAVAYIGLGREPTAAAYDDLNPGAGKLEDLCEPQETLYVMFAAGALPALPVEVFLYAGRLADI